MQISAQMNSYRCVTLCCCCLCLCKLTHSYQCWMFDFGGRVMWKREVTGKRDSCQRIQATRQWRWRRHGKSAMALDDEFTMGQNGCGKMNTADTWNFIELLFQIVQVKSALFSFLVLVRHPKTFSRFYANICNDYNFIQGDFSTTAAVPSVARSKKRIYSICEVDFVITTFCLYQLNGAIQRNGNHVFS